MRLPTGIRIINNTNFLNFKDQNCSFEILETKSDHLINFKGQPCILAYKNLYVYFL